MKKNRIIIEVSGGAVQNVYANAPTKIDIIDWDNLDQEDNPDLEAEYNQLEKECEKMIEIY